MLNFRLILIFLLPKFDLFRTSLYLCHRFRIGGNLRKTAERKIKDGANLTLCGVEGGS